MLVFVAVFFMITTVVLGNQRNPMVEKGLIDLRSYIFEESGPVSLFGEWAFYWGVLVDKENFQWITETKPEFYIDVPGYWDKLQKHELNFPSRGIATYVVKIITGPDYGNKLAIKFQNVTPNAVIYIDGIHLVESGVVHADRNVSKSGNRPRIIPIPPSEKDSIVVAVSVSNFHFISGGVNRPIQIGLYDDFVCSRERSLILDSCFLGGLLLMGLYQFTLYLLNRKRKSTLFMAAICLLALMYSGFRNERVFLSLFPCWEGETATKILYLTLALIPAMFSLYAANLYPVCFKKPIHLFFLPIGIAVSLIILLTPKSFFTHLTLLLEILIIFAAVYNLVVLIFGYLRTGEGCLLVFLGGLPFLFFSITMGIMDNSTPYPIQWAGGIFFVFILYQAFIQAYLYSRVFKEIDDLSTQKTKLEKRNVELFNLSYIDGLTGLCNKRLIDDFLASNWKVNSFSERPLGMILIDIDNLKSFNEFYGQRKGDLCIKKISELIREGIEEDDRYTLGRYGGDEFSLIVSDVDELNLFRLAETVRLKVESACIEHPVSLFGFVTISLGCVCFVPDSEQTHEALLDAACWALNQAKKLGRNRTTAYEFDRNLEAWGPLSID